MDGDGASDTMHASMWKDVAFAAAAAAYLAFVFQLGTSAFRTAGMGDWIDPYFLNYLLEQWSVSLRTLADPASPLSLSASPPRPPRPPSPAPPLPQPP